jgi:hypothetical protein
MSSFVIVQVALPPRGSVTWSPFCVPPTQTQALAA